MNIIDDNWIHGIVNGVLIGQRKTRFWHGEKYIFERVAKCEWKCVYQDSPIIPAAILDDLDE